MFWFKTKEIVVDCFTYHHGVYDYYKPLPANKFIPDGWKSLPKKVDLKAFPDNANSKLTIDGATAKSCVGFINLFKRGFIIQNHTELLLEINADGGLNAVSIDRNFTDISQHDSYQVWDNFYKDYGHIKLNPQWSFVEKRGIKFLYTKCTWNDTHMADNFHVINGVVDYKIQHNAAVNFYVKKNTSIHLLAGQPLSHIIPLSDNDVKLKYHLISKEEYINRFCFVPANKLYAEFKRLKETKKCPFGFTK
jgi:hypothetical protein